MVRIEVQNGMHELSFAGGLVTIGGRYGADVVLRDPMVADRHCVITYEDGFVLRDTGSVVGTWVDGARAAPTAPLCDGSQIVIGSTRIRVAIEGEGDDATLRLTTEPQAFWWQKPGKGAFGNDADQLLLAEARFGRFPALALANRAAIWVGLTVLVAAVFVSTVMEPLADPGPLLPAHALVTTSSVGDPGVHAGIERCVQLSGEQGCDVCHQTFAGVTERKCAQCHGLNGEMASPGTFRHPYHNDGGVADQQFCVRCHTDHQGTGFLKPVAKELLGDCQACHDDGSGTFDREALIASAEANVPPPVEVEFAALRFPHDRHVARDIGCAVCHRIDPAVQSDRDRGVPDDATRHDFAEVPFATCASCHVAGADPVGMTAAQQEEWRATEFQWRVDWHGSASGPDGGRDNCLRCHREQQVDGVAVIGPDLRTIEREIFDEDRYRAERARFTVAARSHDEQFQAHGEGKACTTCHLDGRIAESGGAVRKQRPFWHALHLAGGSLRPGDGAARVSGDAEAGCVSCHRSLGEPTATGLTPGRYHWPDDEASRAACSTCHREGDRGLPVRTAAAAASAAERRAVPDFPHGVHLQSPAFGKSGKLARGCFACHEFSQPAPGRPFSQVPQTLPEAANCVSCHRGHDHVGGGDCQQCHPKADGESNSFLVQARQRTPAWPTRSWPAPNGFSHLSVGHKDEDCATCHQDTGIETAATLADVRAPDESSPTCRNCHLKSQFHWR